MLTKAEMQVVAGCPLFAGVPGEQLADAMRCLRARKKEFGRQDTVFEAGTPASAIGIVLAGYLHVEQVDYWGNRDILTHLEPGDLFGEAFAFAGAGDLPVAVRTVRESAVLLVEPQRIVAPPGMGGCVFHGRLIQNMLRILAQKNVALTQKVETISQRTTRDKLLTYLSQQAKRAGGNTFSIPFDRQQLADYLAVDRSAMSSELSRMQREGLLQTEKNHFALL